MCASKKRTIELYFSKNTYCFHF